MEEKQLVSIDTFCSYHQVDRSFISTLHDLGLVAVIRETGQDYFNTDELENIEVLIRLHQELQINAEGLAAIAHLLEKVNHLQLEIKVLKNKLRMYE
jgi:hypothetical protein